MDQHSHQSLVGVPGRKGPVPLWKLILSVVIVVVLVLGIAYGVFCYRQVRGGYDMSGYQAVFLASGQVYFGKISKTTEHDVILTNIFYLQASKPLQDGAAKTTDQKNDIQLIKLGNELHGPKDVMLINRDQVLFVEQMKDDSQVVKAINNFKE